MHIIQEEIGLPKIKTESADKNHAVFSISPLPSGYGMTLGNAFRRVLLSSLPGAAITAVKIQGAAHEYSTLPGVKDSVLDILLNLKLVQVKKHSKDPETIRLVANKEGDVTAKSIEHSSDIEILNPDLKITSTTSKSAKLEIEMTVEKGVGYVPATLRKKNKKDIGLIQIDAIYSPVKKVRYDVTSTRVGQMTDLDKLTIEVETNGSISPEDALKFASSVLKSYFDLFLMEEDDIEPDFRSDVQTVKEKELEEQEEESKKETYTPIEILNFSPRTLNALINGGIGSIEQLVKCSPSKLGNFRGFGKKAMTEVSDALATRGFALMDENANL
ncbi:DNA-directed RNA polymerase subunit alpha [Patescibacteria group bacterium]|nr:DNA-directed RNA polymerase subunit alpha [Patescibacteria group bacterium]MBU1682591.1 DNA-directed RNA polymerase subunit alpha [Patescibacteria group bacterium]MBU1935670.1 DNA-directed RNA polymerase subunit alpha [Patescibacteria group bacterium]